MPKQKLIKCEIRYISTRKLENRRDEYPHLNWRFFEAGKELSGWASSNKTALIRDAVHFLRDRVFINNETFSLRISNKKGEYIDERTLPRSADPKRSKG